MISFKEWLVEQDLLENFINEDVDLKDLHSNIVKNGLTSQNYVGSLHYDKQHNLFAFYIPRKKGEFFAKFVPTKLLDGDTRIGWIIYKLNKNGKLDIYGSLWRVRLEEFKAKFPKQSDAEKFISKTAKALEFKDQDDAYDIIQDIFDKS